MTSETAPPGGPDHQGENPSTYAAQWRDLAEAVRGVTVTLGQALGQALGPIFDQLAEALSFVGTTLADAFTGLGKAFAGATIPVLAVVLAIHGEDFVVDRMGVSRCDIRSITLDEVRLWNHRRIPLDIDRLLDYATLRGPL